MSKNPFKSLGKAIKGGKTSPDNFVDNGPTENGTRSAVSISSLHDAQDLHTAQLHPDAHPDGGLSPNNDALMKEQREAITAWIKSMGKKVFTGNFNLISTPFPVIMFEPRSYLEKLADVWVYPHYLQQASAAINPLERMKLVVTWFIAGLHHGFEKWKKPFNPILGETWQASLSDGSQMYMEQISHHPPITAFNLEGPGNAYRFTGLSQPNVAIVLKYYGIKTMAKGFRHLDFADGSRIDIHYPGYYIKGVVYSTRPRAEVDGSAIFTDLKNGIRAVVRFGPNKGARAPILQRSDAVIGEIIEMIGGTAFETLPNASGTEELHADSSSDLEPSNDLTPNGASSDDYETGSESDFDTRFLREAAEEQRGTESPVATGRHQRSASQQRVLEHVAGTMGGMPFDDSPSLVATPSYHNRPKPAVTLPCANQQPALAAAPPPHDTRPPPAAAAPYGMDLGPDPGARRDRPSAPVHSLSSQIPPSSAPQHPMGHLSKTPNPSSTALATLPAKRLSEPGQSSQRVIQKGPEPAASSGGLLGGFHRMMGMSKNTSGNSASAPNPGDVEGTLLARIEGSWLSHVNIDGQRYWTLMDESPDTWTPAVNALPSDSRFRQDLVMIKRGDVNQAQKWKEELEVLQRKDKKLREAGGAKH